MSTLDLKLSLNDETRRLSLQAASAPAWKDFAVQVQQRFALDSPPVAMTYIDDEGDKITLSSDAELAELFAASAGETSLSLSVVSDWTTRSSSAMLSQPPPRAPETLALLDSVRAGLRKDLTLVHDLRNILHEVAPHSHHRQNRHHEHRGRPYARRGRGGRDGRGLYHHGTDRFEVKDRLHRQSQDDSASTTSASRDDEGDFGTEKQPTSPVEEEWHRETGSRKGFKHDHHHGPPPLHRTHWGPTPPPPPGVYSSFESFAKSPPPPRPFFHQGRFYSHAWRCGKLASGHPCLPPLPPPFTGGEGSFPFREVPRRDRHDFFEAEHGWPEVGKRNRRHHRF
ncbi:hypothetical protein JCM11251_003709 [Rhodosporidiobolus azoricus]